MLADLPMPAVSSFWEFMLCVNAVGGMIFLALSIWKGARKPEPQPTVISPQPLRVEFEKEFATKDELGRVSLQVSAVDSDLKAFRREIVSNGEERRKSIEAKVEASRVESRNDVAAVHEKVNATARQVAEMNGEMKIINQNLVAATGQLQRVAEKAERKCP